MTLSLVPHFTSKKCIWQTWCSRFSHYFKTNVSREGEESKGGFVGQQATVRLFAIEKTNRSRTPPLIAAPLSLVFQLCGKEFNRMHNLMGHMHLHSDSKPFKCLYCPSKFTLKGNLTRHMKVKHGVMDRGLDERRKEAPSVNIL